MATRIFTLSVSLAANEQGKELEGSPLVPPTGVKWTIVELRPTMSGNARIDGYFDTDMYHSIHFADVNTYKKPHTVALDLVAPHKYSIRASNLTGAANTITVTIVVEESPQIAA